MKHNSLFITKNYIFFTTHDARKNIYIKKITEASRRRLNNLIKYGKVYAYVCDSTTVAFSRV